MSSEQIVKQKCQRCSNDRLYPIVKCSDCGKSDIEFHFKTLKQDPLTLEEHGLSVSKCGICDETFCGDCSSEHADFEAYG